MNKVRDGYKTTEIGEIPEEWQIKKLKDIANICYGKSQKEVEVDGGKYKILGTGGVIGYTNDFLWNKPSVLIGRKGTIDKPQYIEEPFWTVDTLFYTKINENYMAKWFYYYLDNIDLKKYNEATGVPSLSVANLNTIRITTPTYKEQEKIASILSTVDEQIDNVDALIEKNKELKKGLMQTLLTKGIGHTKFKKTEIGEIPEEWNISKLSEITELITKGATPMTYGFDFEDEGVNFIKVENIMESGKIEKNSLLKISEECNNKLSRSKIQKSDILMSIAGTLGRTAIISEEVIPANTNQALAIIRLKKINNVDYINKTLSSSYIKKHINMIGTVGAQPNLSLKQIGDFNVLLPPIKEQEKIASILSEVDAKIEEYEDKKQKLEKLKRGLMQQLLTGKIRLV